MREIIKPRVLTPGMCVGVFTPSFPANVAFRAKHQHGIAELERLGFRVKEGALTAAAASQGYRSGTPVEREAELMGQLASGEAELRAAMEGLRDARHEAEEMRAYIEKMHANS